MGVAQDRAAGEIHGDPLGDLPQRLSGPRPRHVRRAGARSRRALPRPAGGQHLECRRALRLALAAQQGRRPHHRILRHPGRNLEGARGLHQHDDDAGLPQLGTAGSQLCHRAPRRHRRPRAWLRPHRAAPQELRPARGHALHQCGRHDLRQRHLRGQHGRRHAPRRLGRLPGAQTGGRFARQAARPRHGALCRSPRSARRRSAPRSR